MSLTPCRFFAQGTCRYGNNCRFYHEARGQSGGVANIFGGKTTLAQPTFQPHGAVNQGALNLSAKPNQNLDVVMEAVKKDMQEWQLSSIWPYSSYGPVGGKPCVPGFEDLSPEEVRLAFMQNGNYIPPEMTQRFQQIHQLRISYQQPTLENRNIIERIATNQPTSPFGVQPTSTQVQPSVFGGAAAQVKGPPSGSIFGGQFPTQQQQPAASNTFGQNTFGSSSMFQTQPAPQGTTPSIFGSQTQQPQPQPAFGMASIQPQPQSGGLFQQPQQQTGLFQTPPTQTANLFQQQQTQTSLFGQLPSAQAQQPTLGQPQASGLFQQPLQPTTTGLFQQPQAPPQQPQVTFNLGQQQQQGSIFPKQTSSIFGGAPTTAQHQIPSLGATGSIFGGSAVGGVGAAQMQQLGSVMPSAAIVQKYVYSEEADLSPQELEAFRAVEFTLDNLPLKPPPKSLCI